MASLKRPTTAPVVRGEERFMARRRPMVRATGARRAERDTPAEQPPEEKPAAKKTTKKAASK
jgi:hypothetical protein